jgi:hypothetical protein
MSDTQFEAYTAGEDSSAGGSETIWLAQLFTPAVAHKITSVDVKVFKSAGGPYANIILAIRNSTGTNPSGGDLVSASIAGSSLPTGSPGALVEWFFSTGIDLQAGVTYAIVMREDAVSLGSFSWRVNTDLGAYAGGSFRRSLDSGSSWAGITGWDEPDGMFVEYGIGLAPGAVTASQTRLLLA